MLHLISASNANSPRIDVPRRLRRAILLNDLTLVQRIVRNNPGYLRNPDFEDKSNTNLHLAAKHGFTQIAVSHLQSCAYVIDYIDVGLYAKCSWALADRSRIGVPH